MSCPRCGLPPGELRDGYPSPEDIALILEECPQPYVAAFAQALRDHKLGRMSGGASLCFSGSRGETQEWAVDREIKLRDLAQRKRGV